MPDGAGEVVNAASGAKRATDSSEILRSAKRHRARLNHHLGVLPSPSDLRTLQSHAEKPRTTCPPTPPASSPGAPAERARSSVMIGNLERQDEATLAMPSAVQHASGLPSNYMRGDEGRIICKGVRCQSMRPALWFAAVDSAKTCRLCITCRAHGDMKRIAKKGDSGGEVEQNDMVTMITDYLKKWRLRLQKLPNVDASSIPNEEEILQMALDSFGDKSPKATKRRPKASHSRERPSKRRLDDTDRSDDEYQASLDGTRIANLTPRTYATRTHQRATGTGGTHRSGAGSSHRGTLKDWLATQVADIPSPTAGTLSNDLGHAEKQHESENDDAEDGSYMPLSPSPMTYAINNTHAANEPALRYRSPRVETDSMVSADAETGTILGIPHNDTRPLRSLNQEDNDAPDASGLHPDPATPVVIMIDDDDEMEKSNTVTGLEGTTEAPERLLPVRSDQQSLHEALPDADDGPREADDAPREAGEDADEGALTVDAFVEQLQGLVFALRQLQGMSDSEQQVIMGDTILSDIDYGQTKEFRDYILKSVHRLGEQNRLRHRFQSSLGCTTDEKSKSEA